MNKDKLIDLENIIVDDLSNTGEFILPFCNEKFQLVYETETYKEEYEDKDETSHNLLIYDLDEDTCAGYHTFSGVDKYEIYNDNGVVSSFIGFENSIDFSGNFRRMKDDLNKKESGRLAYYVDKDYRESEGHQFYGIAKSMLSVSFLLMKEILSKQNQLRDDSLLFVSRMIRSEFLEHTFYGEKLYNQDLADDDIVVKTDVECIVDIGYQ